MFKRLHHQRIAATLKAFNSTLLEQAQCYFGGGTAIVLSLDEYRESADIDFLCASNEGYRLLRNTVTSNSLGDLIQTPATYLREVRTDQYKIYTVLEVEGTPLKIELVREGRVEIHGAIDSSLHVPVLSRIDLYAQKLLANADRGLDRGVLSRDLIDLAMMVRGWGEIPHESWAKAHQAYGKQLARAFQASIALMSDRTYLAHCLQKMHMDSALLEPIMQTLQEIAIPDFS